MSSTKELPQLFLDGRFADVNPKAQAEGLRYITRLASKAEELSKLSPRQSVCLSDLLKSYQLASFSRSVFLDPWGNCCGVD